MDYVNERVMGYYKLLENNRLEDLGNIRNTCELVDYKYKDKYLIEYLLEKGIHTKDMDDYLINREVFVPFYLKYNIIKPLMRCSLKILLQKQGNDLLLDILLSKLNDEDKINLYNNIRTKSFNEYHTMESDVIKIFLRHGIVISPIYSVTSFDEVQYKLSNEDQMLIDEFREIYQDTSRKLLIFIINELKKGLEKSHDRTIGDIKRLIEFKKDNPKFQFIDTKNFHGDSFDSKNLILYNNSNINESLNHELSHVYFQEFEYSSDTLLEYEKIRTNVATDENLKKVKDYLLKIHQAYENYKKTINDMYYLDVKKKYKSFEDYVEKVYLTFKDNIPTFIELHNYEMDSNSYPFVTELNFKDVVMEFLNNEREEYIHINLKKHFAPYLMLENLLDALFNGALFDDVDFHILSGHGSFYFESTEFKSFDECLADYDGIKKSDKGELIIKELEKLIGPELINFLNNYLNTYRGEKNERR